MRDPGLGASPELPQASQLRRQRELHEATVVALDPAGQRRRDTHAVWRTADPKRRQRSAGTHLLDEEVAKALDIGIVLVLEQQLLEEVTPGGRPERAAHRARASLFIGIAAVY